MTETEKKLFNRALLIAWFVLVYNVAEGIVSVILGYRSESLTLFGFGMDSFIEVTSNLGVIYMINRIKSNPDSNRAPFEKTALRITGYSFYALSAALAVGAVISAIEQHKPLESASGVIISSISIGIMWLVATSQLRTGRALHSQPIIADAKCTLVCIYMSIVLLVSSGVYYLTAFSYIDSIGAVGLVYYSIKEGKEAIENSKSNQYCGCDDEN